jgi:hypothetical protein
MATTTDWCWNALGNIPLYSKLQRCFIQKMQMPVANFGIWSLQILMQS